MEQCQILHGGLNILWSALLICHSFCWMPSLQIYPGLGPVLQCTGSCSLVTRYLYDNSVSLIKPGFMFLNWNKTPDLVEPQRPRKGIQTQHRKDPTCLGIEYKQICIQTCSKYFNFYIKRFEFDMGRIMMSSQLGLKLQLLWDVPGL